MKLVPQSFKMLFPATQDDWVSEAVKVELCGRTAYKSEDRITDGSYHNFLGMISKRNHGAVLEHGLIKVLLITDRGVLAEITRHRLASYTVESTRYCNYSKDKFGSEIAVVPPPFTDEENLKIWTLAMGLAEEKYFELLSNGVSPQFARSVLPQSLKTEIAMTANWREWKHIFKIRAIESAAHPQMRQLMIPLYEHCRKSLPEVFDMGDPELLCF